jgi:hypothetical protein
MMVDIEALSAALATSLRLQIAVYLQRIVAAVREHKSRRSDRLLQMK